MEDFEAPSGPNFLLLSIKLKVTAVSFGNHSAPWVVVIGADQGDLLRQDEPFIISANCVQPGNPSSLICSLLHYYRNLQGPVQTDPSTE